MSEYHVTGKCEISGAGQPAIEFDFKVMADDETQARAAVAPMLRPWPHLVIRIKRAPTHGRTEPCAPTT